MVAASAAAAAAAVGHTTIPARAAQQRHLANKHAMRVSGSDSYALLFLFASGTDPISLFIFFFFLLRRYCDPSCLLVSSFVRWCVP